VAAARSKVREGKAVEFLEIVLVALAFQIVGGKAEVFEPVDEFRREHPLFAVKCVSAEPCDFAPAQFQRADVIELGAELFLIHQVGQRNGFGAIYQRKGDVDVRMAFLHGLGHQKFVEIRVQHGADNGIKVPSVVVNPCGDINHGVLSWFRRRAE